jgi:Rrf2 family protein
VIALNRKCLYALRALFVLAREYKNGPLVEPQIASEANVPPEFLQAILLELRKAGILESHRGSRGGYRLLKPPHEVTAGSVIRILDGPPSVACGGPNSKPCDGCNEGHDCRTRLLTRDIQRAIASVLDGWTIDSDWHPEAAPCVPALH